MLRKLFAFIRLSRPIFLGGGIILYALGALIARFEGYTLELGIYLVGQLFVTSLQLMTHYLNEYWDVEVDHLSTSRTMFSGGSGVLAEGGLSRKTAYMAAMVSLAVGSGAAAWLILQYHAGPSVWAVMALIFLGAYFYSSPPLSLVGRGYGELTTSVVVAGLVPTLGHLLQADQPSWLILLAVVPLVALHYAMIVAFEFPDLASDEAAGKRTLLVRLGRQRGAWVHNALLVLVFGLVLVLSFLGLPMLVAISTTITLPLALWQVIAVVRIGMGKPMHFGWFTFGAVSLFAITSSLMALGFWAIG